MEIDPHNLPEEADILRQIVLPMLGVVDEQGPVAGARATQLRATATAVLRAEAGAHRRKPALPVCASDHRLDPVRRAHKPIDLTRRFFDKHIWQGDSTVGASRVGTPSDEKKYPAWPLPSLAMPRALD
jgi:hypothetical protein